MRLRADSPETVPLILYMASTVRKRPNYIGTKSGTTLGSVPGGPTREASAPQNGPWLNLSSAVEVYWEHFKLRVKRAVSPYLFIFPILLPILLIFCLVNYGLGEITRFTRSQVREFSHGQIKKNFRGGGLRPPPLSIFCPFQSVFCPFQSQRTLGGAGGFPPPLSALPISANANEHPCDSLAGPKAPVVTPRFRELAGTSREPGNLRGNTADLGTPSLSLAPPKAAGKLPWRRPPRAAPAPSGARTLRLPGGRRQHKRLLRQAHNTHNAPSGRPAASVGGKAQMSRHLLLAASNTAPASLLVRTVLLRTPATRTCRPPGPRWTASAAGRRTSRAGRACSAG